MRKILFIFLLTLSQIGFGQSVTSPEPKSFILNTTGQDASGFSLSGFNSTDILLCAIGLPQAPSGTTFYLTNTTGLTSSIGYTLTGNKTRLTFTGTQTNINNALASLKINTTSTTGTIQISVSATINPTGYFYLPTNGHFYRPISGFSGVTGFSGTSPTAYNNLKTYCTQQTFKGQSGYLMTITSSDEDLFVFNNVPGSNIIFALTDNVTEGTFKIDAGPESGTTVRIGGTNQQGQYNNWAGGEPNNYGSGEDYVVTKWGGGNQWNDYGPETTAFPGGISGYVIEFGTWSNPDEQTFTDFYSNSVNHSNGNVLRTEFTFDFGNNVDETKFKTRVTTSTDNINFSSNNSFVSLNGLGRVNLTSQIDVQQINGGYKGFTTPGQVEWSIINPYDESLGGHRLQIDEREFYGTGINLNTINSIQLFDIYNGPITALDFNGWWKQWIIPGNITDKIQNSTFQSSLRLQDGWYGVKAEYTFTQTMMNKYHKVLMDIPQNDLQILLGSAVTVGDVYLAFKEFADKGIMGNESKYFTSGIQFDNADVNGDKIFDERDCYLLLTHLQGTTSLWSTTPTLNDAIKIIPSTTYNNITKQNWNASGINIKSEYPFTFVNGILNSYNLDVTWKGDVNLSHSSQPTNFVVNNTLSVNKITTMSSTSTNSTIGVVDADMMLEKTDDDVILTIKMLPNGNQIGATQFNVFFDESILEFTNVTYDNNTITNFNRKNGSFLSLGSLSINGQPLTNIGYKMVFKQKTKVNNVLGLITVLNTETLGLDMNKLTVKVQ